MPGFSSCRARFSDAWRLSSLLLGCFLAGPVGAAAQDFDPENAVRVDTIRVNGSPRSPVVVVEPSRGEALALELSFAFDSGEFVKAGAPTVASVEYTLRSGDGGEPAVCGADFRAAVPDVSCRGRVSDFAVGPGSSPTFLVGYVLGDIIPEPPEVFTLEFSVFFAGIGPSQTFTRDGRIVNDVAVTHFPGSVYAPTIAFFRDRGVTEVEVAEGGGLLARVFLAAPAPSVAELCFLLRTHESGAGALAGRDFRPVDEILCVAPGALQSRYVEIVTIASSAGARDRAFELILCSIYEGNRHTAGCIYQVENATAIVRIRDSSSDAPQGVAIVPLDRIDRCPDVASEPFVLVEPPAGEWLDFEIYLAFQRIEAGGQTADGLVCGPADDIRDLRRVTFVPVSQRFVSGQAAEYGWERDFVFTGEHARLPQEPLVVRVYGDSDDEPDEYVRVVLANHPYLRSFIDIVIVDRESATAFSASGEAAYAALARSAGDAFSGAISDRFSCAATGRCGAPAVQRRGFARSLVASLTSGVAALAGPGPMGIYARGPVSLAPGAVPAPGGSGALVPGGSVFTGPGRSMRGLGFASAFSLPAIVGSGTAIVQLQRSRGDAPELSSDARAWTLWLRYVDRRSRVAVPGSGALDTGMSGILVGLDRTWAAFSAGAAYGFLRGDNVLETSSGGLVSASAVWHAAVPYGMWRPHPAVRVWALSMSTVRASAGSLEQSACPGGGARGARCVPGVGAVPALASTSVGVSVTAADLSWGVVDVEADWQSSSAASPDIEAWDPRASSHGAVLAPSGGSARGGAVAAPAWSGKPAVRRRVGVRLGLPFGAASRLVAEASARRDSGPDIEVLLPVGVTDIGALDAGFRLRVAPAQAPVSVVAGYRFQIVSSWEHVRGASSRVQAFDAGLRFGAADTAASWVFEVRPTYGYPVPGSALRMFQGVDPGLAMGGLVEPIPSLQLELARHFDDGSTLRVGGSRSFPGGTAAAHLPLRTVLSVLFNRSW